VSKRWLWMIAIVGAVIPVALLAQGTPDVDISFPPPVFVLGGEAEIVGTANTEGQISYFIEYRPLNEDLEPLAGEDTPWLPATLPSRTPIIDDILGIWDTTAAPDGLYQLRLTVNVQGAQPRFDVVSPIRI
jgi:hypothetical protein